MTNTTAALSFDRVVKDYGKTRALHGLSFDIGEREFFTLLGPSGCGKTTLLRLIAGFESLTSGRIDLQGEDLSALAPAKRPVNTVFQHYALFPHLSVQDNVGFGLKMLGWHAARSARRVADMLSLVKLSDFANRRPGQLSGGQQQRVALARAMAPEPRVLLLDEPLSALDLKLRQAMRSELKQLQQASGITFVFVTHDQEEALAMSDRIAVMADGRVQQIGTPREIYDEPVNPFVADFIGQSNVLEVMRSGGGWCLPGSDYVFDASGDTGGDGARLSIRPEQLVLSAGREVTDGWRGRVKHVSYLGGGSDVTVDIDPGPTLQIRVATQDELVSALQPDDVVTVSVMPGAARVLG